MSVISGIVLLLFFLIWWAGFTVSFYRVDRPGARSNIVVAGNLIQAIFHIILPLIPIIKVFDKSNPEVEFRAYKFYSISFAALVVTIGIVELLIHFVG